MQKSKHKEDTAGKPTLNALFISLDKNLFDEQQGDVKERHLRYAKDFNQLNIIVFTKRSDGFSDTQHLAKNLQVFPTNSSSRWMYIADALKVARNIQKQKLINVVSTQDPFITAIAGIVIKLLSGAHLNIQIHNDYRSQYWKNESLQNRVFSQMLPLTVHSADSIRAVSTLTAALAPDQTKVLKAPIAIDLEYFKPKDTRKTIDIVCVARLVKQKNIPLLLSTVSSLVNDFPGLTVKVVGEGPLRPLLERSIKRLELSSHVELVGEQERSQVRDYLTRSKIFILPSNYEGWGIAAMEASACGLPVIMTDTGGARDIVVEGKTGYIVPVGNEHTLFQRIKELLNNPQKRQEMAKRARKHIVELSSNAQEFPDALLRTIEKGEVSGLEP